MEGWEEWMRFVARCWCEVFGFSVLLGGSEAHRVCFAVQDLSIAIFSFIFQDTGLDINYTSHPAIAREAGRQVALLSSTADSSPVRQRAAASPLHSVLTSRFGLCCRDRSLGHRRRTTAGPISSHPTASALPLTSHPTPSTATATATATVSSLVLGFTVAVHVPAPSRDAICDDAYRPRNPGFLIARHHLPQHPDRHLGRKRHRHHHFHCRHYSPSLGVLPAACSRLFRSRCIDIRHPYLQLPLLIRLVAHPLRCFMSAPCV